VKTDLHKMTSKGILLKGPLTCLRGATISLWTLIKDL